MTFPMSQLFKYIYRWCFAKKEEESEEETGTLLDHAVDDWNFASVVSLFYEDAPK